MIEVRVVDEDGVILTDEEKIDHLYVYFSELPDLIKSLNGVKG